MSITAVSRRPDLGAIAQADAADVRARDAAADRIVKLSPLDKIALDGLADPRNVPAIVAMVEDSATALAGCDRHEARIRLVSRALASERARMLVLQGLVDERLAAGSLDAAAKLDAILSAATKRFALLLGEHRAACSAGHRPTVVVGHADEVHVDAGDR